LIIPEVFSPYVIEESTRTDAFLQSGVVQPMAELNTSGDGSGDFVSVPFYKANLSGDFEVLTDSTSLTPGKIEADRQIGVLLRRGRAFEARDLAALASGSDPIGAIGQKMARYVNHQKQKDLVSCLSGVFGSLNNNSSSSAFFGLCLDSESSDSPTSLTPSHVARAKNILGDQGDKLAAVVMHSATYYELVERRAVDFVASGDTSGGATASGGSIAGAFGNPTVPVYMGMRVVVSDDVQTTGTGASKEYAVYFMTQGAVGGSEVTALRSETDRDILSLSDALAISLGYCYHPIGAKWGVTTVNPTRAQLETVGNWSKVYETKNIGIVRSTVVSSLD
jgi:hypothetical protein